MVAQYGKRRQGRTNAERRHELELAKLQYKERLRRSDNLYKLLRQLVLCGMVVGVAYCMYLSIDSLAGKNTTIDGFVQALANIQIDRWIFLSIAAVCGVGWAVERRLRRKTIKDLGSHAKDLESQIAPERKSSGLLPDGRATKEDKEDA